MNNRLAGILGRLLPLALLFATNAVRAESAAEGLLKIEITGLTDVTGSVYLAVYDNESDWLGEEAVTTREVDIAEALQGEVVTTELQLPLGSYAFSIFYDANGNGELDTNFIGMPKEPIALSNNARARFGPPKYEDAAFALNLEPMTQRVIMNLL